MHARYYSPTVGRFLSPDKSTRNLLFAVMAAAAWIAPLSAEEQAEERYIVILKQRAGAAPEVASLGGTIESRQDEQLVVRLPAGAAAALKADPKVLYVQRVGGADRAAEEPLAGVPAEPEPGLVTAQRLRPQPLGTTPWDSGTYSYDGAGNIISIGTDAYVYDGVQRLTQSSTTGMVETYTYDGFGNMKTRTGQTIPPVLADSNRYEGWTYNEIGAVTSDLAYAFTYDALGQPLSKIYEEETENYVYTASDERIGVRWGEWWTWSVRDEGGKVLRQYRSSATTPSAPALWIEDFVWRDGLLLGAQRPVEMGGRKHFHLDHLGTPRLVTSDNGQKVSLHDYYPFGDEKTPVVQEADGGFDREEPLKFTGHERDFAGGFGREDGNYIDYMHARYYGPGVGRFFSVDPVLGNLLQPQSLNRYAYVFDNPINYVDPLGLAAQSRPVSGGSGEDCPKGVICLTPYEADLLEWLLYKAAHARSPITGMTAGEHARATGYGLMAFADGVIPFADPLEEYYSDGSVEGTEYSKKIGEYTRDAEIAIASSGSETIFGVGRWVNTGKNLRVGHSTQLIKRGSNRIWFSVRGRWVQKLTGQKHFNLWIVKYLPPGVAR